MKLSELYWHHITLLHLVLWPLSLLFGFFVRIRNACYRLGLFPSFKLTVPVIIVDSISIEDNGKTPLATWLVEMLLTRGLCPGIITHGNLDNPNIPAAATTSSDPTCIGGKALLLAKNFGNSCPVWVGSNPVITAQALLKAHPSCNIVICIDGLLDPRLERDLEIALVDFSEPSFGNGLALPAGPLRTNLKFLQSVDAVVANNTRNNRFDTESWAPIFHIKLVSETIYNLSEPNIHHPINILRNKKIHAVTSYDNSIWLMEKLQRAGFRSELHSFSEDHRYIEQDLSNLDADAIIMPEEDAIQCQEFAKGIIWALPVDAWINNELQSLILNKLRQRFADSELLNKLVCPQCECNLRFQEKENLLICDRDNLSFPIRDGIPYLQNDYRSAA